MARTRTLLQLRSDVRVRADIENATGRFPDSELTRYVNQGIAELYDLLVDARGLSYYRSATPHPITTTASTVNYALPTSFYKLIGVRISNGPPLERFDALEEPEMARTEAETSYPLYYDLRGSYIALRPYHEAGYVVLVEYVPHATELSADVSTFDGINGWEEYVVAFAARCCLIKDERLELAGAMLQEMERLKGRIAGLAPNRDGYRPTRIRDARAHSSFIRPRWFR